MVVLSIESMSSSFEYPESLALSHTKEELLTHLRMPAEIYSMMTKEVDIIYRNLTADRSHMKQNSKHKPPYDWSDLRERSKEEAIALIAKGGNEYTLYYWNLAGPTNPNWIAKWFLYHKFRYRDGRNRNGTKREGNHLQSKSSRRSRHNVEGYQPSGNYQEQTYPSGAYTQTNSYGPSDWYGYGQNTADAPSTTSQAQLTNPIPQTQKYYTEPNQAYANTTQRTGNSSGQLRYDPVRDVH